MESDSDTFGPSSAVYEQLDEPGDFFGDVANDAGPQRDGKPSAYEEAKRWVEEQKGFDDVQSPSGFWWAAIGGPLTLLLTLAFVPGAYRIAKGVVPLLPPRTLLRVLVLVVVAIHVGEAAYAYQLAKKHGLNASGWAKQTFIIGFPSLMELHKKINAHWD